MGDWRSLFWQWSHWPCCLDLGKCVYCLFPILVPCTTPCYNLIWIWVQFKLWKILRIRSIEPWNIFRKYLFNLFKWRWFFCKLKLQRRLSYMLFLIVFAQLRSILLRLLRVLSDWWLLWWWLTFIWGGFHWWLLSWRLFHWWLFYWRLFHWWLLRRWRLYWCLFYRWLIQWRLLHWWSRRLSNRWLINWWFLYWRLFSWRFFKWRWLLW